MVLRILLLFSLFFNIANAQYYDWPMWRYDHGRTASTPEKLADRLYLQWQVQYTPRTPVWDDPLNQDLMKYDRIFEPIIYDGKLFVGFNDQDKVVALDLNTGNELWHYYADGPVRLPLAANKGKIYFTSDDGNCYCLDAGSGKLLWKRSLTPGPNKLIGNRRMISMWPARGGIVIKDDVIYTASSIFPLMGTYIYALDASDGEIIWKNEGTSSNYILQPHNSPAFADIAPQGCFTISGDKLMVAGGRSVPAAFDMKSGQQLYYYLANNNKTGGAFTCANEKIFFNHHRARVTSMYDTETGSRIKSQAGEYPVIDENRIYFSGNKIRAAYLNKKNNLNTLWEFHIEADNDLIKAGDCLYASDSKGKISVLRVLNDQPEILWEINTGKNIERLIAGNGKLVAVSEDGAILVYGDKAVDNVISHQKANVSKPEISKTTAGILDETGITEGYATVYGSADHEQLMDLVTFTKLKIIVLEKDPLQIEKSRSYFDNAGIPASRLSFLPYKETYRYLPKYYSSLTIINDPLYLGEDQKSDLARIYESVRPYGGKIYFNIKRKDRKYLEGIVKEPGFYGAEISENKKYALITRSGALEGAADWTHNYGNIANTVKSDDQRVKAPLGLLWFGGNSNLDVLPRHGHGPAQQIMDGLLIIQGINTITARDVYTGRTIWQKEFENLKEDSWQIYYDETYDEENPLDPKYNQIHLPGANARGTNFIVTKEYVYVIEGNKCHLLDLKTGKEMDVFTSGDEDTQNLAYIGVYEDYLILGNNFSKYDEVLPLEDEKTRPPYENFDVTASKELIVMNRFSGEKLWSIEAKHGFIHNSVIVGKDILFCLDKLPQAHETRLRRRGLSIPEGSCLYYLDIASGKVIHEERENIFGTWLGYSAEHNVLLQATRPSSDMLTGEFGKRMILYDVDTKKVIWDKEITYNNPPILFHDKIYTREEAFTLLTGDPIYEKDPVTHKEIKWGYKREYGCGYIIASEHLLTFRSASAAFVNLNSFEGTASLGGWKAGCSANLIAANGVLNSPDYTRTCHCAYQNQTSLALIHMPWMNYWTNSNYKWDGDPIRQLGLNMNAPGDRMSLSNTLWIDFPNVGGTPSDIPIKMDSTDIKFIRKEPYSVNSEESPWIIASAIEGLKTIEIPLANEEFTQNNKYRVNLYFAELDRKNKGERIFNVRVQDETAIENLDIIKETGQADKELVKTLTGIVANNTMKIELIPVKGNTIISGIELIMEN